MPLILISETLLGILFDSRIYILYDHNLIKGFIDIYKLLLKIELAFSKSKFKIFWIARDFFRHFWLNAWIWFYASEIKIRNAIGW